MKTTYIEILDMELPMTKEEAEIKRLKEALAKAENERNLAESKLLDYETNILIERQSLPRHLVLDKNFMQLYDLPNYSYLYDRNFDFVDVENMIRDRIAWFAKDVDKLEAMPVSSYQEVIDKDAMIIADNQTIVELRKILHRIENSNR